MANRTLGPFPKSIRWRELVGNVVCADVVLDELLRQYEQLIDDDDALRACTLLVGLVVCSRVPDASDSLKINYGIELKDASKDSLLFAADQTAQNNSLLRTALKATVLHILNLPNHVLFGLDTWKPWRAYDGRAFCDLARLFFCNVNEQYFARALSAHPDALGTFAWEMSLITRTFSARWFNACARDQIPNVGSIRWYLGHCIGKLQLEVEREKSDWVEPTGNPWKRRRKNHNANLL